MFLLFVRYLHWQTQRHSIPQTQTVCLRIVYAGMLIRESWVLIEVSCISSLILPMIDTFDG